MALKLLDFKCKQCGEVHEQIINNNENIAEDLCKFCSAQPDNLEPVISNPKHKHHVSWSTWKVN